MKKQNRKRGYPRLIYPFRVPGYGQIVSPRAFRLFQFHYRRLVFAHKAAVEANRRYEGTLEALMQEEFQRRTGL